MPFVASFSDITTAISVLLPTYIVMDVILAWVYRKSVAYSFLWPMAAAGIFGVFVAALFFRYVDIAYLAIFLGAMSFIIGVKFFVERAGQNTKNNAPIKPSGRNWTRMIGLNRATGFTSFFLMGERPNSNVLGAFPASTTSLCGPTYLVLLSSEHRESTNSSWHGYCHSRQSVGLHNFTPDHASWNAPR